MALRYMCVGVCICVGMCVVLVVVVVLGERCELLCVVDVLTGGQGGQRTGPLSEEWLLTPDPAG